MTAITTMVGFGSLVVNPIPNISKMGVFAVAGIGFTFIITITVLPSILSFVRSEERASAKKGGDNCMDRFLERLAVFDRGRRLWIGAVSILVTAVSLWGMSKVEVDTNFLSYFDEESDIRKTRTSSPRSSPVHRPSSSWWTGRKPTA